MWHIVCLCVVRGWGSRGVWGIAGVSWLSCSCMPPHPSTFFSSGSLPPPIDQLRTESSQTWMSPFCPIIATSPRTSTHIHALRAFSSAQFEQPPHPTINHISTPPPNPIPHPCYSSRQHPPPHTTTNTFPQHNITHIIHIIHNITTNRPHYTLTTRGPCRAPPRRPRRCRRRGWSGARARWSGRRGGAAARPPPAGSSLCPPRGAR